MQKAIALPAVGYVRLPQILKTFPVSKSAWWKDAEAVSSPSP